MFCIGRSIALSIICCAVHDRGMISFPLYWVSVCQPLQLLDSAIHMKQGCTYYTLLQPNMQ